MISLASEEKSVSYIFGMAPLPVRVTTRTMAILSPQGWMWWIYYTYPLKLTAKAPQNRPLENLETSILRVKLLVFRECITFRNSGLSPPSPLLPKSRSRRPHPPHRPYGSRRRAGSSRDLLGQSGEQGSAGGSGRGGGAFFSRGCLGWWPKEVCSRVLVWFWVWFLIFFFNIFFWEDFSFWIEFNWEEESISSGRVLLVQEKVGVWDWSSVFVAGTPPNPA